MSQNVHSRSDLDEEAAGAVCSEEEAWRAVNGIDFDRVSSAVTNAASTSLEVSVGFVSNVSVSVE